MFSGLLLEDDRSKYFDCIVDLHRAASAAEQEHYAASLHVHLLAGYSAPPVPVQIVMSCYRDAEEWSQRRCDCFLLGGPS